ncbi:hypothetical protein BH708_13425 [Brachybacterium sp. P6-10-X1]|uniref:hypothetical protein n=1 Tax=Brachybacterium sp. P6-10-X1 TaxID=1903186 RepID=UPI000971A9C9|nr:hypothetical protein [Brachybacterium sp. P6-10-X1]APX33545.1 hypothetical protein BH708_13425 [Brachybacterium sp. P6-10-X1]
MTTTDSRRTGRRRLALTAGLVLTTATGFGLAAGPLDATAPQLTDAAWVSEETAGLTASAASVSPAVTTCEGRNGAPNLLHLDTSADGLPVSGYLVTITVDGGAPDGWNSGQTSEGYPLVPADSPTYVPATTSTVAWGITGGWNQAWAGDVSVEAVGPGGWSSPPVSHEWAIGFDFLGGGYGSCT